ncbi:helix-turn-helix domain-containing protein [Agilicoccus flavus]|uniref:helix-turn-helix domain-containing protein n=1 Tax=Agilicoccus flavus TaxID=2775968 RepID=UPI001CF68C31|nr:helix-turn-helix transcriptional regulator [Agilicoccus flavus]
MSEEKKTPPPSVLGTYIRAQRQLADLSLRQLATMSNVSNAYLSQVERGLHQPSLKVIRAIGEALDISTERLLAQAGMTTAATAGSDRAGASRGRGLGPESGAANAALDVVEAILADELLVDDEKQALLTLYRTFVDRHRQGAS